MEQEDALAYIHQILEHQWVTVEGVQLVETRLAIESDYPELISIVSAIYEEGYRQGVKDR